MEDRIDHFERRLADNLIGLLSLANEHGKAGRHEHEAVVLERYVAAHVHERTVRQRTSQIRFRVQLTEETLVEKELV